MEADKFDICYPLPNNGGKYVVPLLLSEKIPTYNWQETNNFQLQYVYDQFMPEGILSQFIVKVNEYIVQENNKQIVWKSGVVLERKNTKAEIIEHTNGREIRIKLYGNEIKELQGIIMDKIDSIINRFPKQPEMLIPCNCKECKDSLNPHFYKYSIFTKKKGERQNKN